MCTPDHPVYDPDAEQYAPAVRWLEGHATRVLRVDEEGARVQSVVSVRADAGLRRVFDLTVESEHHDFVANGVLVHNKSPGCQPGDPQCDETGVATGGATTDSDTDPSSEDTGSTTNSSSSDGA